MKRNWIGLATAITATALLVQPAAASPSKKHAQYRPPPNCYQGCGENLRKTLDKCDNPTCEKEANEDRSKCMRTCASKFMAQYNGSKRASHVLPVTHHAQKMPVWCWAASIAMVAEFLEGKPVDDCDVASKLDRSNGGSGVCCDGNGDLADTRCLRGRAAEQMVDVMKAYSLHPTEFHRPLTWDELRHSIDAGYPIVIGIYGGGMGHAEVVVGYREPSTVLLDDPWKTDVIAPDEIPYTMMAGEVHSGNNKSWRDYSDHAWRLSWYFPQDEVGGYISNRDGDSSKAEEPAAAASGPAKSSVAFVFPAMPPGDSKAFVEKQAARGEAKVRACYDDALAHATPVASPATVKLSFGVDGASPSFVMIRDSGGLPGSVTGCIAEAMTKWTGLFPKADDFDSSQKAEMTFRKLAVDAPAGVAQASPAPGAPSQAAASPAPKSALGSVPPPPASAPAAH